MNKTQAYRLGVASGYEAGMYGDFTNEELVCEDAFAEAAAEICDNKRQFADSPTYSFVSQPNRENLFDAFDNGEAVGIRRAWYERDKARESCGDGPASLKSSAERYKSEAMKIADCHAAGNSGSRRSNI